MGTKHKTSSFTFPRCIKARFLVCFATWFALICFYLLRGNMSVAILVMVEQPSSNNSTDVINVNNLTDMNTNSTKELLTIKTKYDWNKPQQANILAAFFYGYASTHIIGSFASAQYGPRLLLTICIIGASVFTLLTPFLASVHPYALFAGRFIVGFFSGSLYPILQEILGVWTPVQERTILATITHSGNIVGLLANFSIGGFFCGGFFGEMGWQYFFYLTGGLGLLSGVVWILLGFNNPLTHPCISSGERTYVSVSSKSNEGGGFSFKTLPIKQMLTSLPVWAATSAHFGNLFIFYAFITGHAKFLSEALELDAKKNSKGLSPTVLRKVSSGLGFVGSCTFVASVGFLGRDKPFMVIAFMSIALGFLGLNISGYMTAAIDIAPSYAGIIMGFMNTFGSIAGVISSSIPGLLIKDDPFIGWRNTFIVTSAVTGIFGLFFVIFGSSELQPWARSSKIIDETNKKDSLETENLIENSDDNVDDDDTKNDAFTTAV